MIQRRGGSALKKPSGLGLVMLFSDVTYEAVNQAHEEDGETDRHREGCRKGPKEVRHRFVNQVAQNLGRVAFWSL